LSLRDEALKLHKDHLGKIEVISKVPVSTSRDLTLAYTPGVAEPCREIKANRERVYDYTSKGNMIAIVTDGTRVLGLGDIGPEAGLPVMEGKAILFKGFAGVDAFPICLATKNVDEIVAAVKAISPVFSGINLEDIEAPKCFEVEEKLKNVLDIPVFHDDQHGTAVVTCAGLFNALKSTGRKPGDAKIVMNGAGAAGVAIVKFLMSAGVRGENLIVCDSVGAIYDGRTEKMHQYKAEIAKATNPDKKRGSLQDVVKGEDVLIGASGPRLFTQDMIRSMARNSIVFALANPVPEITPPEAKAAGARVAATGRSDFPNQINNVLGFPGIFRGALDVRARSINEEMKVAAANAIASLVRNEELNEDYVIPKASDVRVVPAVASGVAEAAMKSGVARIQVDPKNIAERAAKLVERHSRILDLASRLSIV